MGVEMTRKIHFINKQLRLERKAETKFTELNDSVREYHEVFGHKLSPLPQEPVLSDSYTPSNKQACSCHLWHGSRDVILKN